MSSLFQPVPRDQRNEGLRAYDAFLAARNGEADFEQRTLALRESRMRSFAAVTARFPGAIDEALFRRQLARFDPRVPTPRELLLILAYVKMNAGEAYGVETTIANRHRPGLDVPFSERMVALEETYHTRILLSAADLFGLKIDVTYRAPWALRLLIGALSHFPQRLFHPLLLAAEIVGVQSFWRLFRATGEILRDHPEIRDALQERVADILVDEIGHISFNRLHLGRPGLAAARALVPVLARSTGWFTPEAIPIGVANIPMRESLEFELADLPEHIRQGAFVA